MSVEFEGVDELLAGMQRVERGVSDDAPKEFEHVASQVADQVRGRLPRRTGALAGSVEIDRDTGGAGVGMGSGVPYAQFVEYGGRGFPHNPQGNYLTPAAMDATSALVRAGESVVKKKIGEVW